MARSKYGKYIIKEPVAPGFQVERLQTIDINLDAAITMFYQAIKEPAIMIKDTHKHDFHQLLCFMGGNPLDIRDFGAEIELSLGEEGEKHIIDTTTIVNIPAGLPHCPLNFKKIDKPIVFLEIMLAAKYEKHVVKE